MVSIPNWVSLFHLEKVLASERLVTLLTIHGLVQTTDSLK